MILAIQHVQVYLDAWVSSASGKHFWDWVVEICPYCGGEHKHGGGYIHENPFHALSSRRSHCKSNHPGGEYLLVNEMYREQAEAFIKTKRASVQAKIRRKSVCIQKMGRGK